jgi:transposase
MIQITPHMRILVAIKPADFRRGIDGLAQLCREELKTDPFTGAMFVFRNRRATSMKALVYDGQGFWLCQKRLSRGRFVWWPRFDTCSPAGSLEAHELQLLLWNGDPQSARAAPAWRRLPASV